MRLREQLNMNFFLLSEQILIECVIIFLYFKFHFVYAFCLFINTKMLEGFLFQQIANIFHPELLVY